MKHLRKYNEANAFTHDPEMNLIKEIILELKHEFPSLEGEIINHVGGDFTYTIIKLKPLPIYNEYSTKISNIDKRMTYFNTVIDCSKRLQEALDREVRVQNLFDTNQDNINIWIDDAKNKGKRRDKWG
jgi:hypothetical protein